MIELVLQAQTASVGAATVARILPQPPWRMTGPFIFLDHFGPVEVPPGAPKAMDVEPHPHIGISTLTWLFEGAVTHRDSLGTEVEIRPGEVNWMTAGRGISHSERMERLRRKGGRLHGLQAWIALPDSHKAMAPAFSHLEAAELPAYSPGPGIAMRLIAGEAFGRRSPLPVFSPLFLIEARLDGGGVLTLPEGLSERSAYVVSGLVRAGGRSLGAGTLAMFEAGSGDALRALTDSVVMLLGGESVGPRVMDGNFVASSAERIKAAQTAWFEGGFPLPPHDPSLRTSSGARGQGS